MSAPASNRHQEADREIQSEQEDQESETPQITILFDESAGVASTASNFYFVFDMSGSMDEKCSGKRKIDGAKEAVARFMKNIPDDVNIGLMLFGTRSGDDYAEALPIGSGNKDEFLKIINSLQPEGQTPLGEALLASVDKIVEQYKKQLGYGTYRIIIITDGEQTGIDLKQTLQLPCPAWIHRAILDRLMHEKLAHIEEVLALLPRRE